MLDLKYLCSRLCGESPEHGSDCSKIRFLIEELRFYANPHTYTARRTEVLCNSYWHAESHASHSVCPTCSGEKSKPGLVMVQTPSIISFDTGERARQALKVID